MNTIKEIERVENIIFNMIEAAGYKEETFFEFERVNDNKTIFKMKWVELSPKTMKETLEYVIELVPNVQIYPRNEKTIELRVY